MAKRTIPVDYSSANASGDVSAHIPDQWRDIVHGRDPISSRRSKRGLRHSIDDRAFAILNYSFASGDSDPSKPFGAIAAHSGEHDSDHGASESFSHGKKERIGSWPHAPHRWRCVESNRRIPRLAVDGHMIPTRSEVDPILPQELTIHCLPDPKHAHRVEPLGEELREFSWHVLNDDNSRAEAFGKARYDLGQSPGSARRRSD